MQSQGQTKQKKSTQNNKTLTARLEERRVSRQRLQAAKYLQGENPISQVNHLKKECRLQKQLT